MDGMHLECTCSAEGLNRYIDLCGTYCLFTFSIMSCTIEIVLYTRTRYTHSFDFKLVSVLIVCSLLRFHWFGNARSYSVFLISRSCKE